MGLRQVSGGVEVFVEESGTGTPIVLVHGSWVDHDTWAQVVPLLAERFRVITYDRRGHSQSPTVPGQGTIGQDVDDLAALIEKVAGAPALIVGNSFGSLITLRLAAARPDLVRGIVVHEPPGIGLLAADPNFAPMLTEIGTRSAAVVDLLIKGDHALGAETFVETIALGPGMWSALPSFMQDVFIRNAPTFLDECLDPTNPLGLDLNALANYTGPALLTQGDTSPPMFAPVLDRIHQAMPTAKRLTYTGAGHTPQLDCPDRLAETIITFANEHAATPR